MAKRKSDGSLCEEKFVKFTSGEAFEEDFSFEWKIKNFLEIKKSKDHINEQQFSFEVGESNECPTKWNCYLFEKPETKNIGIFFKLKTGPPNFRTNVTITCKTIKQSNTVGKWKKASATPFLEGEEKGFAEFISADNEELKGMLWEDGSIVLRMTLKLLIFKPVVQPNKKDVEEEVKRFENGELQKLSTSMTRMIYLHGQAEAGKIIKVLSRDQVGFNANTATLSARSPVFKAMFESGHWMEGQGSFEGEGGGGSLILEDLSGKTVNVLLHYMHGGVLLKDDWKAEDVILELTYAAQKYQLEGLTEFLDKVLPGITFSSTEILAKLTLLTKRLGMKNAEKGLFAKF